MNWNLKPATWQAAIITGFSDLFSLSVLIPLLLSSLLLFLTLAKFESIVGDEKIKTRDFITVNF